MMVASPVAREPGFYWVRLGENPPETAHWDGKDWWLCGYAAPWESEALEVVSERLIWQPTLSAGRGNDPVPGSK